MDNGADEQTGKGKGKRLSTRVSRRRTTTTEPVPACSSVQDAAVALSDGDAQSLAHYLRALLAPAANYGGPQHVCLKRAFALMDSRWEMSVDETFPITAATTTAYGGGTVEPSLVLGSNDSKKKRSPLSPELFAHVVGFLNPQHALRTTWTCKAWWRNVSGLPLAAHLNLCNLRSRRASPQSSTEASMGWQDVLNLLRHIKSRNPHRVVRRLTLNGSVKLGSIANLSSATAGLLTHVDFSRARGSLSLHQIGVNMPGLRGLGVQETLYDCNISREWVKSLAKLVSVVSLESLRVCAEVYGRKYGEAASDGDGTTTKNTYTCRLNDSFLVTLAAAGDSLRKLWLVTACGQSADVEDGMATLGAAVPNLEVLTTDLLKVTDRGWAEFAAARLASKRCLVSICIKAPGATYVPSETTRAVLMDAVTESLLIYGSPSGVCDRLSSSSPPPTLVDCEERPVVVGLSSEKLCVTSDGPWRSNYVSDADDL